MKEITAISKRRLEHTLEALNEDLKILAVRVEEARALGDLSENEEYSASLSEYTTKMRQKSEIEYTLKTSTVKQSYSTNISHGSLISVKILNQDGSVAEDLGLLLFDEKGSAVFSGVVSEESSLGRAIQGGVSGEYIVQNLRGADMRYQVTLEPESKIDEYLMKYPPDRQKILDRLFADIK